MQQFEGGEAVHVNEYIRFHKFSSGEGRPVFVVPPHAGRHGNVVQGMINKLVAAGKTVYAYELLPATTATSDLSIAGMVEQLSLCFDLISQEAIDVLGVCQGGWLSSIYAALNPERVARLALFASPINTKTGEHNLIEQYCRTMSIAGHRMIVDYFGGVQPGFLQWTAFSSADPQYMMMGRYLDQVQAIVDEDYERLAKLRKVYDWLDSPNDLGRWFLEALEHLFRDNKLYDGTWEIADGVIPKLDAITCPVYVYAGGADIITHPEQARGILEKISSKEKCFTVFEDAGHTAVFVKPANIEVFMGQFYKGE